MSVYREMMRVINCQICFERVIYFPAESLGDVGAEFISRMLRLYVTFMEPYGCWMFSIEKPLAYADARGHRSIGEIYWVRSLEAHPDHF